MKRYLRQCICACLLLALAGCGLADPVVYGQMKPPAPGIHPRICLTPDEVPILRERVKVGVAKSGYDACVRAAKELADPKSKYAPWIAKLENHEQLADNAQWTMKGNECQMLIGAVKDAALVGVVRSDPALIPPVKRAFLAYVRGVSTDVAKNSQNVRQTNCVGFAYDWLYNDLSEGERTEVRKWLVAVCTTLSASLDNEVWGFKKGFEKNRSFNFVTFLTGAFGITALAIEGEEGYQPDWYTKTAASIQDYLHYGIGAEGGPEETIHYFAFGMQNGIIICDAMARRGYPAFEQTNLRNVPLWWAYDLFPFGKDFNDLQDTRDLHVGLGEVYYRLALAYPKDPVMQWVNANYLANQNGGPAFPAMQALWATDPDPKLTAADLKLPLSRYLAKNGLAYMRSGWGTDDLYLEFQSDPWGAGPSHSHADRNSFTVAGAGRLLVADGMGWFPQDIFHNLVFIDGKAEGIFPMPGRIVAMKDGGLAAASMGDAKKAYDWEARWANDPGVQKFEGFDVRPYNPVERALRTTALVRGSHPYVMVVDDIKKDATPHEYAWQMISPTGTLFERLDQNRALLKPTDSGAYLMPDMTAKQIDPLRVPFTLPAAGRYRVWVLMGRESWTSWTWGAELALDGQKYARMFARESSNGLRHWQPVLAGRLDPALELTQGAHTLNIKSWGQEMQFTAVLVAPDGFEPSGITPAVPPANSQLIRLAELTTLPRGWKIIPAEKNAPQMLVQVLNPTKSTLEGKFERWLRPDAKEDPKTDYVESSRLRVRATLTTTEPKYRVFLYPHRVGDPIPTIKSTADSAVVSWPDGTVDSWTFGPAKDFDAVNGAAVQLQRKSGKTTETFEFSGR
jgi:hypothetical protein